MAEANQQQQAGKFFGDDIMSQLTSSSSEIDHLISSKLTADNKQSLAEHKQ
jgi:hypothetical protein